MRRTGERTREASAFDQSTPCPGEQPAAGNAGIRVGPARLAGAYLAP